MAGATRTTSRSRSLLLGVIATILIGWVLHVGATIVQPIVIALLLAIMLQPVVFGLARKGIPPVLTVVLITGLLFYGLFWAGLQVQASVANFLGVAPPEPLVMAPDENAPTGILDPSHERELQVGSWSEIVLRIQNRLEIWKLPTPIVRYAGEVLNQEGLEKVAEDLALSGLGFVRGLLLVLIYMVFIFAEQAVFRSKILSIAGERRADAESILDTIGNGIQRYLSVKTGISLLTGSLCFFVLAALEVPYAPLFGVVTFLLNYIPTFGSIIAAIFPTITALAVEDTPTKGVIVLITYLSVNLTLGSYVEPRILGRELNLSPLVVVISVVVWAGLWGVVGGFLAVPLTAGLQIVLASREATRPIAIMLGSGPPKDRDRSLRKRKPRSSEARRDSA